jgi:hypothetical protein
VVAGDLDVAALTMRAAAGIAASAITFKIEGDAVRRARALILAKSSWKNSTPIFKLTWLAWARC